MKNTDLYMLGSCRSQHSLRVEGIVCDYKFWLNTAFLQHVTYSEVEKPFSKHVCSLWVNFMITFIVLMTRYLDKNLGYLEIVGGYFGGISGKIFFRFYAVFI